MRLHQTWVVIPCGFIMDLLLVLMGLMPLSGKPIHHQIKDALVDGGYLDIWSPFHLAEGIVTGWVMNSQSVENFMWYRLGIQPWSTKTKYLVNLTKNIIWEVPIEFGIEGHWDWEYYNRMYNGKALQNNLTDIALDMFGFALFQTSATYWDIKVWLEKRRRGKGFELRMVVPL